MTISTEQAIQIAENINSLLDQLFKAVTSSSEKLTLSEIIEKSGQREADTIMGYILNPPEADFKKLGINFVELSNLKTHTFDSNQLKFYLYTLMSNWLTAQAPDNIIIKGPAEDYKKRASRLSSKANKPSTTKTTTTLSAPTMTATEAGSETDFYKKIQQMGGGNRKVNVSFVRTEPFSKYVTTPKTDDSTLLDITTELTKEINKLSVSQKIVAYSFLKKLLD
jgi:hypothetical protein